jgi:hypothetical protein
MTPPNDRGEEELARVLLLGDVFEQLIEGVLPKCG